MITAEFTSESVYSQTEKVFQWDVNQVIKIMGLGLVSGSVEVHFANKKSANAIVVNSTSPTAGTVFVNIPNTLLTEPYDIVAYVYQNDGTTRSTTNTITIPVVKRQKPSDHIDTGGGNIIVPDSGSNVELSSATATRDDIVNGKIAFTATGRVVGTHACPDVGKAQVKNVTPTKAVQTVEADEGYYLWHVNVNPIPSDYVLANKTETLTSNGEYDVKECSKVIVDVPSNLDTSDATATANDIVEGKTAYVNGVKITGTYMKIATSFDATTGTLTITEG